MANQVKENWEKLRKNFEKLASNVDAALNNFAYVTLDNLFSRHFLFLFLLTFSALFYVWFSAVIPNFNC